MDRPPPYEMVRDALERAITDAGTNPKRLALQIKAKHGTSETLVRDILKGKTRNPTIATLDLIAAELGKPVGYFFGAEPDFSSRLPSVEQTARLIRGFAKQWFPDIGPLDDESLQGCAAAWRAFLLDYAKHPGRYAEPDRTDLAIDLLSGEFARQQHRATGQ